jgi:hypothetical protein
LNFAAGDTATNQGEAVQVFDQSQSTIRCRFHAQFSKSDPKVANGLSSGTKAYFGRFFILKLNFEAFLSGSS